MDPNVRDITREGLYPLTAKDALKWWDQGDSIFSVEMGGLGPGYEQCIQILAFEIIREGLRVGIDFSLESDKWKAQAEAIRDAAYKRLEEKGYSGAQVGAATSLAFRVMKVGWAAGISEVEDDRHIQVERAMPQAPKQAATS